MSDRQKQIIEVSLELIAESGIQGLTIKNLAKRIGFSEAAIYRHYENKIQILMGILGYFRENTRRLFSEELLTEGNALMKINHLLINQIRIFTKTPPLVAVVFSEELFRNEVVLSDKVSEIMNNSIDIVTGIIKQGQERAEIRNDIEASHLSLMVMGTLRLFVKQWQMSDYSFDLQKKGNELSDSMKRILSLEK